MNSRTQERVVNTILAVFAFCAGYIALAIYDAFSTEVVEPEPVCREWHGHRCASSGRER